MAIVRQTVAQKIMSFQRDNPNVIFINGKWFNGTNEININKFLLLGGYCGDSAECKRFLETYIMMNAEETQNMDWPQLAIVNEAVSHEVGSDLAYPLTRKELLILYYLLFQKSEYVVFFYGIGGSGKSTVLDIYKQIFDSEGYNNTAIMNLSDISHFNIQFASARLILDDDCSPDITEKQAARLKTMATNGPASFEGKGKDPFNGQYRCKLVIAGNTPMRFNLTDDGMLRRIVYYSKNEKIKNPNSNFQHKKYSREELKEFIRAAYELGKDIGRDWVKEFQKETREIIMTSHSIGKYGMSGNYDAYVNKCDAAGIHAFGMENYDKIYALFRSWQQEEFNF